MAYHFSEDSNLTSEGLLFRYGRPCLSGLQPDWRMKGGRTGEKKPNGTNHNMLPWHAWMDKNQFDRKQIETKVVPFPPFPQDIH